MKDRIDETTAGLAALIAESTLRRLEQDEEALAEGPVLDALKRGAGKAADLGRKTLKKTDAMGDRLELRAKQLGARAKQAAQAGRAGVGRAASAAGNSGLARGLKTLGNAVMGELGSGAATGRFKQARGLAHLMNKWKEFTAIGNKPWTQPVMVAFLGKMFGQQAAKVFDEKLFKTGTASGAEDAGNPPSQPAAAAGTAPGQAQAQPVGAAAPAGAAAAGAAAGTNASAAAAQPQATAGAARAGAAAAGASPAAPQAASQDPGGSGAQPAAPAGSPDAASLRRAANSLMSALTNAVNVKARVLDKDEVLRNFNALFKMLSDPALDDKTRAAAVELLKIVQGKLGKQLPQLLRSGDPAAVQPRPQPHEQPKAAGKKPDEGGDIIRLIKSVEAGAEKSPPDKTAVMEGIAELLKISEGKPTRRTIIHFIELMQRKYGHLVPELKEFDLSPFREAVTLKRRANLATLIELQDAHEAASPPGIYAHLVEAPPINPLAPPPPNAARTQAGGIVRSKVAAPNGGSSAPSDKQPRILGQAEVERILNAIAVWAIDHGAMSVGHPAPGKVIDRIMGHTKRHGYGHHDDDHGYDDEGHYRPQGRAGVIRSAGLAAKLSQNGVAPDKANEIANLAGGLTVQQIADQLQRQNFNLPTAAWTALHQAAS